MVAAEMANYLTQCENGFPRIKNTILRDIKVARERGDEERARHLLSTLHHFVVFASRHAD